MSAIAEALVELQKDLPRVGKAETAQIPTKSGGTYSYSYADLSAVTDAIFPKLTKLGLSWSCSPTLSGDRFVLNYALTHASGEAIGGAYPLPEPSRSSPQDIGSAITYARRYALLAVTGVQPQKDDDDATKAEKAHYERIEADKARAERDDREYQREQAETWKLAASKAMTLDELRRKERDAARTNLAGTAREAVKQAFEARVAELKAAERRGGPADDGVFPQQADEM